MGGIYRRPHISTQTTLVVYFKKHLYLLDKDSPSDSQSEIRRLLLILGVLMQSVCICELERLSEKILMVKSSHRNDGEQFAPTLLAADDHSEGINIDF